jgi:hypothetical protein
MINKFKLENPQLSIEYFQNERNVGPDESFIRMARKANGVYSWLMGDDDEVICRNVRSFVHLLKEIPEMSVIQANFVDYDKDLKQPVGNSVIFEYVYKTYKGPQTFMIDSKGRYGFAGAIIYNTKALLHAFLWVEVIGGFHFISTMMYILIRHVRPAMIYGQPLINRRTHNECWQENGGAYIINLINRKHLAQFLQKPFYSDRFIKQWKRDNYWQLFESIIVGRYKTINRDAMINKALTFSVIKGVYSEFWVRSLAWVMLYFPIPRFLLGLVRDINRLYASIASL